MPWARWELSLTDKNQRFAITQISGFLFLSPNGNQYNYSSSQLWYTACTSSSSSSKSNVRLRFLISSGSVNVT